MQTVDAFFDLRISILENGIYPTVAVPQVEFWALGWVAQIQRTEGELFLAHA